MAVTADSGDSGFGVQYPAASAYVTAVGGTTPQRDGGPARGWSETAWSGAGSGCSSAGEAVVADRPWQLHEAHGGRRVGGGRPRDRRAVYDCDGAGGWMVYGGTSVAAPIVAGVYALVGNAAWVNAGSYPYANRSALNDVTSGSNGRCNARNGKYLCTAMPGFNSPSRARDADGTAAF